MSQAPQDTQFFTSGEAELKWYGFRAWDKFIKGSLVIENFRTTDDGHG